MQRSRNRRRLPSRAVNAAAYRVGKDGAVPLRELCEAARVSEETLRRWARDGKAGVHLDAIRRKDGPWLSSVAALCRFLAEVRLRGLEAGADPGMLIPSPGKAER